MFCTQCGHELSSDALACPSCNRSVPHFEPLPKVQNFLVPSIIGTIFCCLPVGVVALIYAAQVNSKLAAGDVAGAQAASRKAKGWMIATIVVGILIMGGGVAALALWQ